MAHKLQTDKMVNYYHDGEGKMNKGYINHYGQRAVVNHFRYNDSIQSILIPAGVNSISVHLW